MGIQQFTIGALSLSDHTPISLGPRHPTQAGLVRAKADIREGRWHDVDLTIGYGHRGAEKLFEVRDFRSAIMLANRHEWWSAVTGELLVTQAIESAMRLTPPRRAVVLRTMLAELARIHSHLGYLSYLLDDAQQLWAVVEEMRRQLLHWSGNRVHPMLHRVGGLANDLPLTWEPPLDACLRLADTLTHTLHRSERFRGLAVIDEPQCIAWALSGPIARAAGLDLDRRGRGELAYAEVSYPRVIRSAGDAHSRFEVLIDEVRASVGIVRALGILAAETPGEVSTKLSRRLKVPEGEHWAETEAPWGIAGALLVSRGGPTPWRLALRTPSFANLSALAVALDGVPSDSIADAIASVGYSVGDADK